MSIVHPVKILVTSAGSTHGVNVIRALQGQKELDVFLVAADANPLSAGLFMADAFHVVPRADDPNFVSHIAQLCEREGIGIIIPTFSFELEALAAGKNELAERGVAMAISPTHVFEATEDKRKADRRFRELGVLVPKIYSADEIEAGDVQFPLIVKPVRASGSKGVVKVHSKRELDFHARREESVIVQEFVEGKEYTIDGLCDLEGKMVAASPRVRLEVWGGLATKSMTVGDEEMTRRAGEIAEGFGIVGPFNVQCIRRNDGQLSFIEINSRFPSGGLPLTVKAGFNIPLAVVKLLLGERIHPPVVKPGIVMLRCWDALFVEETTEGFYRV